MKIKEEFKNLIANFLDFLTNIKNYSTLTVKTYDGVLEDFLENSEIYEENGIVIVDITKYRIAISNNNSKTISKKISSIKSFINYLKDNNHHIKLIGANSIKVAKTLPKPIRTDDILDGLKLANVEEKTIVTLIYSFGLRISELASLKLKDIKTSSITVLGKGNKQREIPANSFVLSLIKKYKDEFSPKEYLFEKDSKAFSVRQLQYRVEKVFKKIGISATPHQLRHSFATDLLNNGARINDISELLGHSSLSATSIYTKLNTSTKYKQYLSAHPLNQGAS